MVPPTTGRLVGRFVGLLVGDPDAASTDGSAVTLADIGSTVSETTLGSSVGSGEDGDTVGSAVNALVTLDGGAEGCIDGIGLTVGGADGIELMVGRADGPGLPVAATNWSVGDVDGFWLGGLVPVGAAEMVGGGVIVGATVPVGA
jgi:hypothetical protein